MRPLILLLLSLCLLTVPASAYELTLTFDEIGASGCDQIWYERGLPMYVTTPVAPECGSSCWEGFPGDGEVLLANGTLRIDVSTLADITRIEMDGDDYASGLYLAVLENGDPKDSVVTADNAALDVAGVVFDEIRVNSCEGFVTEIRILGEGLATVDRSWGCLKALFGER